MTTNRERRRDGIREVYTGRLKIKLYFKCLVFILGSRYT